MTRPHDDSHGIDLEFRMLGELQVRRGGQAMTLPPSKKTRALLAYLVLSGRPHRREALCELLWDVTDDPRGALRWSLSKLRKLVDDGDTKRVDSDRERVAFRAEGAVVDLREMQLQLSEDVLSEASTDMLERWCERCNGEVLEGLDLPDFDNYQAWLVTEREEARRTRARALSELVGRLGDDPARALRHCRSWSQVDPMSLEARMSVLRMTLRTGKLEEAKRYYEASRRTFAELDPEQELRLRSAWHSLRTHAETPPERAPATPPALATPPASTAELDADTAPVPLEGATPFQPSATTPPLTGRQEELRLLSAALTAAGETRRARMIVVLGEPGIGKSRLLSELVQTAQASRGPVLVGAAYEGEAGRPYGPWIDALKKLPGGPSASALMGGQTPRPEAQDSSQAGSREALFAGVAEGLSGLTNGGQRSLLVVLEDSHWLDEGSAELLHHVVRSQRDQPILFVLSARPAELSDNRSLLRVLRSVRRDVEQRDLPLKTLPEAATAALVAHVNAQLEAAAVHQRSGGNPLYALELARSGADLKGDGSLPDAIRERLDRLSAEASDLLRWCAVLGASIDPQQLAELSSLDVEAQVLALEELEKHALLRPEGAAYGFAHDVVKQVVYAGLSQPRRVLMHRRTAEALRSLQAEDRAVDEATVADIARHAAAAGDHALAAEAHVGAAARCVKLMAPSNATTLVRRGLHHARQLREPDRARAMLELHEILLSAERPKDAEAFCATVQALSETALEHGCVAHARLGFNMQSYLHWERGEWTGARKNMNRAEEAGRAGEGEVRIAALAQAARCEALIERDMGLAEAYLKEAVASSTAAQPLPTILDAEALLRRFAGDLDQAGRLFQQARVGARAGRDRFGELHVLVSRAEMLYDAGQLEAARELAEETSRLADKARDGSERPYAELLVALAHFALGDDTVEPALRAALAKLRELDAKHRATFGLNRAALLFLDRDQYPVASAMAGEALQLAELMEWRGERAIALVTLARVARTDSTKRAGTTLAELRGKLEAIELHRISAHARTVVEKWRSGE